MRGWILTKNNSRLTRQLLFRLVEISGIESPPGTWREAPSPHNPLSAIQALSRTVRSRTSETGGAWAFFVGGFRHISKRGAPIKPAAAAIYPTSESLRLRTRRRAKLLIRKEKTRVMRIENTTLRKSTLRTSCIQFPSVLRMIK